MKNSITPNKTGNRHILFCAAIVIAALLLSPSFSYGQNTYTNSHDFNDNLKYYPTAVETDGGADEMVTAGTIFEYPNSGQTAAHFLAASNAGNIAVSKSYDYIGVSPRAYEQVRVVHIVGDGAASNAIYYMICLARPAANSGQDRILVIPVDKTGALASGTVPFSIAAPNSNENLYPIHAILHSTGDLYICGYLTDNGSATTLPNEPGYTNYDHTQGFVIKVHDPNTTTPSAVAGMLINTVYNVATGFTPTEDHDIAMRLVETSGNDIFVTGSVNNRLGNAAPYGCGSATMNLTLDQGLSFVHHGHFFSYDLEYGVGLVEDGINGNYVIGNHFGHRLSYPYTTFDTGPSYLYINYLDNNMGVDISQPACYVNGTINYAWAISTLPTHLTPTSGYKRFTLAGMTLDEYHCVGATFTTASPSLSNVQPF